MFPPSVRDVSSANWRCVRGHGSPPPCPAAPQSASAGGDGRPPPTCRFAHPPSGSGTAPVWPHAQAPLTCPRGRHLLPSPQAGPGSVPPWRLRPGTCSSHCWTSGTCHPVHPLEARGRVLFISASPGHVAVPGTQQGLITSCQITRSLQGDTFFPVLPCQEKRGCEWQGGDSCLHHPGESSPRLCQAQMMSQSRARAALPLPAGTRRAEGGDAGSSCVTVA